MCRRVTCRTCGKATWAGCGQHVDSVMAGIPRKDRCPGHHDEAGNARSSASQGGPAKGLFARLLGR